MTRRLLSALFLLALFLSINALPVDKRQAQAAAESFLRSKGTAPVLQEVHFSFSDSKRSKGDGNPYYYLYNVQAGGFVIMAADDCVPAILAYSEDGALDDDVPPNMRAWLSGYEEIIETLRLSGRKNATTADLPQHEPVEPMLTCNWAQGYPYNLLLPECHYTTTAGTDSIGHCNVGCEPTAMAQLMHYHQWPETLPSDIPGYQNNTDAGGVDAYIEQVDSGTVIPWNEMLDTYTRFPNLSDDPETSQTAVATLMRCCAQSVKSVFSSGSSSYGEDMPFAFTQYFGYAPSLHREKRSDYITETWDSLIYHELEAGRPVLYEGATLVSGHVFVVDGTDGTGLYHVNWGWSGVYNGYFLLLYLNPTDDRGHDAEFGLGGYALHQYATVGIEPARNPSSIDDKPSSPMVYKPSSIIYDLQGRRVHTSHGLQKGIYIIDGKKRLR